MSDDLTLAFGSLDSDLMFGYDFNCDPCNRRDAAEEAVGYCTNCREYLCRECYNVHCIPSPSEDHITILLSTEHRRSGSTDRDSIVDIDSCIESCTDTCSVHEGRVVKYYCALHKKLGCKKCRKTRHALCEDVLYIPEASKTLDSNQVQEFSDKVDAVKRSTNQMFKTAQQHIDTTEHNHVKVLKDVEHFRQEIYDWADKLSEDMKQLAERNKNENIGRLQEISEKYTAASEHLQEINDKIQTVQNDGNNCKLFVYMKKAEEMVQSIQEHLGEINTENRTTLYKFKPRRDILQKDASLGSLHEKEKLGHYWVSQTDHLEAIYIRSGKDKYNRVSKRHSRHSVKGLATDAFSNRYSLDMIKESNEAGDF